MRHRLYLAVLVGLLLITAACNLRENSLLPPNLDPKEYIMESTIRVYSDHLIKSENDDSYLYIPKESIADSSLWYNDTVSLRKVDDLTERDSLAFVEGTTLISGSYSISILREGQEILLDSIPNFATLYTDLRQSQELIDAEYVQSGWRLSSSQIDVYPYGSSRCFFDIDGNGDVALMNFHEGGVLSIDPTGKDVQGLIKTDSDYVYAWFPSVFITDNLRLELQDSLTQTEINSVQRIFPGFALNTKILSLSTNSTGTGTPIIRYRMPANKHFNQQWLRLAGTDVTTWQSGNDTWLLDGEELVTWLGTPGKYFLITPISGQTKLDIPLDGTFNQLFLQDLWLDLNDTALNGYSLSLDLSPDTKELIQDYFSGSPFALQRGFEAFGLEFKDNGSIVEKLPGDAWIEYGFATTQANPAASRLFLSYRTTTTDHLYFKTYAKEYDSSHFTQSNGYVYAGYASSGTYLYGVAGEASSTVNIPCLRPTAEIQTTRTQVSWEDESLPCTSLSFEYGAQLPAGHPWLSGSPFTVNNSKSLLKLSAISRKGRGDELPLELFISTVAPAALKEVLNISLLDGYPKFIRYKASTAFAHNTFVMSGSRLQISPAYAGYLISGSNLSTPTTSYQLALFNRFVFDNNALEVYLDSSQNMPVGTTMQITPKTSMTDSYGVLASQYQLTPLSPGYDLKILNNLDFYTQFSPYIRIRQNTRTENLLFSISEGEFYRIYTYDQADTADGWHFNIADGHVAFYLVADAEYALAHDDSPHTILDTIVNVSGRDFHSSLYQAQFVLPSEFIGNQIPIGTRITLNSQPTVPQGITPISAYQLFLRNSQQTMLTPGFYTIVGATRLPYIYLPITDYSPGQTVRLYYRNLQGVTTEFTRVTSFSEAPTGEFIMVGNCAVCFVNNPGLFYATE